MSAESGEHVPTLGLRWAPSARPASTVDDRGLGRNRRPPGQEAAAAGWALEAPESLEEEVEDDDVDDSEEPPVEPPLFAAEEADEEVEAPEVAESVE